VYYRYTLSNFSKLNIAISPCCLAIEMAIFSFLYTLEISRYTLPSCTQVPKCASGYCKKTGRFSAMYSDIADLLKLSIVTIFSNPFIATT